MMVQLKPISVIKSRKKEDISYEESFAIYTEKKENKDSRVYSRIYATYKGDVLDKKYPQNEQICLVEDAAKEAIQSPLLETSIEGAKGVIINITGGEDLGLHEVNTAAELVQRSVDPEANIIFGTVTDTSMQDEIQITVIATGFETPENNISSIGVENIVSKTWEKKINSIPSSTETSSSQNDLDIPAFLRKNRNKNM